MACYVLVILSIFRVVPLNTVQIPTELGWGRGGIRGTTLHHTPRPPLGGLGDCVGGLPQVAPRLADAGVRDGT